jgi:hypothetical protein
VREQSEKIEREKREEKEEAAHRFKLRPVTSDRLERLSRVAYSGATAGHAVLGGCVTPRF